MAEFLHVANFFEAPRYTAKADGAIAMGQVTKLIGVSGNDRLLLALEDADAALLVEGNYGVAYKVSEDPDQVQTTTGFFGAPVPAPTRDRVPAIVSGDLMVELRPGCLIEYTAGLLHDSLNPGAAGTTPSVGDALEIKDGLFAEVGTTGAITSPIIGRTYKVFGTNVIVELLGT